MSEQDTPDPLQAQLDAANAALAQSQSDLATAQTALQQANSANAALTTQNGTLTGQLGMANATIQANRDELDGVNGQPGVLARLQTALTAVQTANGAAVAQQQAAADQLARVSAAMPQAVQIAQGAETDINNFVSQRVATALAALSQAFSGIQTVDQLSAQKAAALAQAAAIQAQIDAANAGKAS